MGRKNKNIIGGAASGAGAGMAAGPYGALAGAGIGAIMGSMEDDSAQQLAPAIPQDVVDRLYRQSQGGEQTVGELKAAQMYDKTLAQQIAAAKANRGVNPALLSRNVSRIAAEQSQANAASMAEVAAQERARALQQYLSAQQLNAGVAAQNAGFETAANKKSDSMLAGGLTGLAGNLALKAQREDAGSMRMVSDERQKDLVKSEDLPVNNNMAMQNQTAMLPQGVQEPSAAPAVAQQPMPQAAPAAQPAPQPAQPQFGLTSEMLAQAQKSSKGGGNVSDIKNQGMTLSRGLENPDAATIQGFWDNAKAEKDWLGFEKRSRGDAYNDRVNEWRAAQAQQNAAYDKEAGEVAMANQSKDLQRTARLNRFYTGVDTNTAAVASQYAPKVRPVDLSLAAQYNNVQPNNPFVRLSDENQKEKVKGGEKSADFNPKSFLDKLEAVSWEYKDSAKGLPGVEGGRQLGVMAQKLEKAGPVGENMVDEDAEGNKIVDYGKGFSAILASQAHLNKRLEQIESQYTTKKKKA